MHESFSIPLSNKRLNFLAYSPQMAHLAKALLLHWRDEHSANRAISERNKDIVGWKKMAEFVIYKSQELGGVWSSYKVTVLCGCILKSSWYPQPEVYIYSRIFSNTSGEIKKKARNIQYIQYSKHIIQHTHVNN